MKFLRLDNVGEYASTEFKKYLASEVIEHQFSIPRRPEQNRVAERMNRILTERVLQTDMSEGF